MGIMIKIEKIIEKKQFETWRIYFIWLQWQPYCFNSKQSVSCSRTNDICLDFFTHFIYTFIITWILSEKLKVKLLLFKDL